MKKIQVSGRDILAFHQTVKNSIKLANPTFVRRLKSDTCPCPILSVPLPPNPEDIYRKIHSKRGGTPFLLLWHWSLFRFLMGDLAGFFSIFSPNFVLLLSQLAIKCRVSYGFFLDPHLTACSMPRKFHAQSYHYIYANDFQSHIAVTYACAKKLPPWCCCWMPTQEIKHRMLKRGSRELPPKVALLWWSLLGKWLQYSSSSKGQKPGVIKFSFYSTLPFAINHCCCCLCFVSRHRCP